MKKINFRKVTIPADTDYLYHLMSLNDQYLFSSHLHWNTIQQFESWLLNTDFKEFHILEYNQTSIGFVFIYDVRLIDGHCKLNVYIDHQYRNYGLGALAGLAYLDLLFNRYPFRKIYSTIYSYNNQSLESNLQAGFIEEGRIPKYRYYNNNYYDLCFLSISREEYMKRYKGGTYGC